MSKMPHWPVAPPGQLYQGRVKVGKYELGQKKLQEISFVYLITSCLRSGSGRPRAAGLGGLGGAVIHAPGASLHPLPEFPGCWCPRARLKRAAASLSSLSYSATRWQVQARAKEEPGPSRPAPFPPLAWSFAPHELFVPAQSPRSNSSPIPPSQVSCRVGHTPVLAHVEPELGNLQAQLGPLTILHNPGPSPRKVPVCRGLRAHPLTSLHHHPPRFTGGEEVSKAPDFTQSVSPKPVVGPETVCPRVCPTSKATSQLKRGGYGDSS